MPFKGPNPPAEPTDFDPNDRYKDPVVYFQHREALLAEHTLKEAEIRLIREELKKCYRLDPVNHQTECKDLAQKYLKAFKEYNEMREDVLKAKWGQR